MKRAFYISGITSVVSGISCVSVGPTVAIGAEGYSPPIHVLAPVAPRCINSNSDEVTVSLRRVLIQKQKGLFLNDKQAGVAVIATLNAKSGPPSKTPSVTQLDIKDEAAGQVSLALEYPVASQLALKQGTDLTQNMQLSLYVAKTRTTGGFGTVLTLASNALQKLPIPANPYTTSANKVLDFANTAIQNEVTGSGNAVQFADLTLQFADHDEDVATCLSEGNQVTGALAVIRSVGEKGVPLLPVSGLDENFCFRYSTTSTYELQSAPKTGGTCGSIAEATWKTVPNDYVMLLVAAAKAPQPPSAKIAEVEPTRFIDLENSKKLCDAVNVSAALCGVE